MNIKMSLQHNKTKRDIENERDIVLLVNTFYQAVQQNETLGYIFNDVAKVNWETHLPKMYAFWSSILLGKSNYAGNPMEKHIALNQQKALTEKEFGEWLLLFNKTVDDLFDGNNANEAKLRAGNIARLMLHKVKTSISSI